MRTRSLGLALFAGLTLMISACSTGGSTGQTGPKIGLVTDVGSLDDKNFNQYSWEGAQDGASKVGGTPKAATSAVSADIAKNIQSFVDQKYDIIVTVGFAAGTDTAKAAKANPAIKFIGVDQSFICITETGDPDTAATPACKGDPAKLLPNYQGIGWREQQPGYLAGIVAASLSKTGTIGAVGGTASVPAVPNYIAGYINGAKSVKADIKTVIQYVSAAPDKAAFADAPGGKAFAQQMLAANKSIDVLFQVAGLTGNGVLQAACEANIVAIGVDVDQFVSTPATGKCTAVSAEKKLKKNVSDAIVRIKDKKDKGRGLKLDLTTDDVGLSPFHDYESKITADTKAKIAKATADMKAGTLQACPPDNFGNCPVPK